MKLLIILLSLIAFSNAKIFISKWQEAVTPLMVDHIKRSLQKAEKEGGSLFILELNTPGGLESSMREVIQEFQRTSLPVVVFVYPPGGRAASAGAIITISADVAAMAPGTNIGAATPVQMGGEKMDEAMKQKVMQDMLAFVRSIAKEKGRNPQTVEKMVTKAISLTPEEALKEKVIDIIATDRKDLLEKLDGKVIKKHGREVVIKTKGLQVVEIGKSLREEFLSIITNPTIAYMLLLIGFYGIFFELYNPGTIIPGTVGVICFLAFSSLSVKSSIISSCWFSNCSTISSRVILFLSLFCFGSGKRTSACFFKRKEAVKSALAGTLRSSNSCLFISSM